VKKFMQLWPLWLGLAVAFQFSPVFVKLAHGCGSGCEEQSGVCACFGTPEIAPSVVPSDEKPRHNGVPSWQSGEVVASTQPSCAYTNNCSDQKQIDAAKAGKKAANVP
jgi:hypothetical protein